MRIFSLLDRRRRGYKLFQGAPSMNLGTGCAFQYLIEQSIGLLCTAVAYPNAMVICSFQRNHEPDKTL